MLRPLLPVAFVGFIALGLPEGVLGVAWPSIGEDFDRVLGELGLVLALLTAGYLLAGLANGELTRRFGTGRMLTAASLISAAGALTYAATGTWVVLLAATFCWGAAASWIDAGINAHVAVNHGARAMGFLHASFGIGATIGPLLMTVILETGTSWRGGYYVLGTIQLALTAVYWRTRDRWESPVASTKGPRPRPAHPTLLWVGLAVFFLYTGIEVAAGQWSFTLLTESRDVGEAAAGLLIAGYWGSLTIGRIAMGVAGDRITPGPLLGVAMALVVAALVLLWWNPADWVGAAGLLLAGLALAPIFPILVLLTPDRLGAEFAPWAIGFQLSAAALGAALIPGGIGLAVEVVGLESVGPILAAAALAMAATSWVLSRVSGPAHAP